MRLALTDDDTAAHGAFDGSTQIVKELSSAKHMLCVFHAVVMKFQEVVYRLLPRRKKSKDLSDKGAIYGKSPPSYRIHNLNIWRFCQCNIFGYGYFDVLEITTAAYLVEMKYYILTSHKL